MTTAGGGPAGPAGSGQALAQSEERFRLLVDSVMDYAIFMLDPDGMVESWNAGAQRLKGYTEAEIVGRHYSTFYTEADRRDRLPDQLLATAKREGRVEISGWRIRKDGTQFWANVVITALWHGDGTLAGFAKVTRDMTDQHRNREAREKLLAQQQEAVERLEHLDTWRKDFIAAVAHDLRNPVSSIIGFAELAQDGHLQDPTEVQRVMGRILSNAYSLDALIDHLRTDAMLEAGAVTLRQEPIDLRPLVEGVIADMHPFLEGHEIELDIEDTNVLVDRSGLERILRNLVGNAARHNPGGVQITVTGGVRDGALEVVVADTGEGIRGDQLGRVFERFERGGGGGSGLGLSIVKQYVELHGGEVWVTSQVGAGSRFGFRIPQ